MDHNRKIIYLAGFLFSVPIGLALYINSSFLSSFIGESSAGIVFALGSISSILVLLIAPKIFKKLGAYKFLLLMSFLNALSFLGIALVQNTLGIIILFIAGFCLDTLIIFSLDEILEITSRESNTGKIRGTYLTIYSFALILAQVCLSALPATFSFRAIYFVGFLLMLIFCITCFVSLKDIPEPAYDKLSAFKFVTKFFQEKKLFHAYGTSFLVNLFYSWMIIYTPIYLYAHLYFSWQEIGTIFSIMLLPFTFIPVYAGRYADKIGERKLLMFGFMVVSLATISLFFIYQHALWIWALVLFMTRIGIATAESMSDTYFFKHIKPKNEEWVGVYRSAAPAANVLGPVLAFVTLMFLPSFNYIFIVLGTLMLCGVYLSSTIKKSDI